jgi:hypothetical protein
MKEIFICGYVLSTNNTPIHIQCKPTTFNDEYREISTDIPQFFSDKSQ